MSTHTNANGFPEDLGWTESLPFIDVAAFWRDHEWTDATPFRNDDGWLPGTVLRDKDGAVYLVGDVNRLLGTCDDCRHEIQNKDVTAASHINLKN